MNGESDHARQWLRKARNDLLNADNNLTANEIPLDTVCFHCQQAAEKILKAYLAGNGAPYPFTIPYAVEIRYPDEGFTPAEEDAEEARQAAEGVLRWLEKTLPEIFEPE
ncbi:MAG: HEPN domain-containing protein [Planctomycetota bacterium]|nr:HEPN domain-containing protein [Planctomycetota bacterium]MDA1138585.1 HEPN domain-containing protein [Planctomycetota bacterium]